MAKPKRENLLTAWDRAVAWFSPAAGVRRAQSRAALQVYARHYEGASTGTRRTDNWRRADASPASITGTGMEVLRARSRDLVRNTPHGRRSVRIIHRHVVGSGIVGTVKDADGKTVKDATRAFARWAGHRQVVPGGRSSFYGAQRMVVRGMAEAGEMIVRRRVLTSDQAARLGLEVPLQLQVLEPDYIDASKDGEMDGGRAIQGVLYDAAGNELGIYVFPSHPGDRGVIRAKSWQSTLLPSTEYVRVFEEERAGQVHGVPWLAAAIVKAKDFDEYNDAQVIRQKIAACFTVFVEDTTGDTTPASTDSEELTERVEPGLVQQLGVGKSVKFAEPPGVDGYAEFRVGVLQDLAAAMDVTYEALTSDYSRVNYSSGRMGWLELARATDDWQWQILVPQMLDQVWAWWYQVARVSGVVRDGLEVEWTTPRREMIDVTKESIALRDQVRSGLRSPQEAMRELGQDPESVIEQWSEFAADVDARGLIFDTDPRRVSAQGLTQARPKTGDGSLDFPDPDGSE